MNTERHCPDCRYWENGFCKNLELKPCYPQKGCDDFSKRNKLKNGYYDVLAKLPDNCTNWDMIKAMFPDAIKSNYVESDLVMQDYVTIYLGDYEMRVSYDWCNAPYKLKGD